jgi:ankyrin repeat protein
VKDEYGKTPLHLAASSGKTDTVGLLLESWPGGMSEKAHWRSTPLHLAACDGRTEVVGLLVGREVGPRA